MEASDRFYREILNSIHDGIYFVDTDRVITFWNNGAERLTGYTADEVVGSKCMDNILVHVDETGEHLCTGNCPAAYTIETGDNRSAEVLLHHKNGHRMPVHVETSPIHDKEGRIIGALEIFRDNTAALENKQMIDDLKKAALIDTLTGLPNRRHLEMRLSSAFEDFKRYNIPFGVIFSDIDHFKRINDEYGHTVGDEVLKMVGKTLSANVRATDLIGRWGGEEFLGILTHTDYERLVSITEKLRRYIEASFIVRDGKKVSATVTIGVTQAEQNDTPESIIARADTLLYKGKEKERNCVMKG